MRIAQRVGSAGRRGGDRRRLDGVLIGRVQGAVGDANVVADAQVVQAGRFAAQGDLALRADHVGHRPVLLVGDVHGLRGLVVHLPHHARVADRPVGPRPARCGVVLDGHPVALLQALRLGRRLAVDRR